MLHNSLLIQDFLKARNNNPLCKVRRDPHRLLSPSKNQVINDGDIKLAGTWTIQVRADVVGKEEIGNDLMDFLEKMGLEIEKSAMKEIEVMIVPSMEDRIFKISIKQEKINIQACCSRDLWAAVVYLEKEMTRRGGPILPAGEITKKPEWRVQISQAPWGANFLVPDLSEEYLSIDAFRLLAHYGINGMTIYGDMLCYVNSSILPELNALDYEKNIQTLRDASERASKYGVSFYYVVVSPKLDKDHPVFKTHPNARGSLLGGDTGDKELHCLCSSDDESLSFHEEFTENLFTEVPLLGGVILIVGGESYYHCYMNPATRLPRKKTNCESCAKNDAETVVSRLVEFTARGVHKVKSSAPVLVWPYSAHRWSKDPYQIELIESLPKDSSFHSEIDKDQWIKKDTYSKSIWDYSVDFTGPSDRIVEQASAVKENGLDLYIKSETALGLELIHLPYVPSIQRALEKWGNVHSLHPIGVLQSWMFFGMWGSRNEELGFWKCWHPEMSSDEIIHTIAERDFGEGAPNVIKCWGHMSEAIGHLPCIPPYFMGPFFLGPAHPLVFKESPEELSIFSGSLFYKQEHKESFSSEMIDNFEPLYQDKLPASPASWGFIADDYMHAWDAFMEELSKLVEYSAFALNDLKNIAPEHLESNQQARLNEELNTAEFLYRTFLCVFNSITFLRNKEEYNRSQKQEIHEEMKNIARSELENTIASKKMIADGPWLNLNLRVEGRFKSSTKMIEKKIQLLEEFLSKS
ncbi:MAG: hypothetical protein ACFFCS_02690 [Candidatus Hodarchaeota archaeon]